MDFFISGVNGIESDSDVRILLSQSMTRVLREITSRQKFLIFQKSIKTIKYAIDNPQGFFQC